MALPQNAPGSWIQETRLPEPSVRSTDYELYKEGNEFVLVVELPGYDPEELTVSWDDGVLNVAAESQDDGRGQRRTFHQRFRFPKTVDDEAITAEYTSGILGIRLPIEGTVVTGREIEVEY